MDKLSVMNAYCRIVERGSFARAAQDLGVSPALLSREVKLLEESLGCMLLTRSTRSMSLTDQGRLYYEQAQGILHAVNQVEDRIRDGVGARAPQGERLKLFRAIGDRAVPAGVSRSLPGPEVDAVPRRPDR